MAADEHGQGHDAAGEHAEPETPGGLDVQMITVVGVTTVLLVIVAVYAVQAWYFRFERAFIEQTQYQALPVEVQRYQEHEERRLHEPRLRDPEQDLAAIPIDRAMDLYIEQGLESAP